MSHWSIEPLRLYRSIVPGPEAFFQRGFDRRVELAFYSFLLRSAGRTVLIDTGLPADYSALNANIRSRKGHDAGFREDGPPLAGRLIGVTPDAIVLTSLGPYAVGGLVHFAEGPIHASARGLADLAAPEEHGLRHPIDAAAQSVLASDRVRPVRDRVSILPGITLCEVGIHHPASLAVIVECASGPVAIADPVFLRENLITGIALGAAEHAAGWHRMVRDLGAMANAIIPIHDPEPRPVPKTEWHTSLQAD